MSAFDLTANVTLRLLDPAGFVKQVQSAVSKTVSIGVKVKPIEIASSKALIQKAYSTSIPVTVRAKDINSGKKILQTSFATSIPVSVHSANIAAGKKRIEKSFATSIPVSVRAVNVSLGKKIIAEKFTTNVPVSIKAKDIAVGKKLIQQKFSTSVPVRVHFSKDAVSNLNKATASAQNLAKALREVMLASLRAGIAIRSLAGVTKSITGLANSIAQIKVASTNISKANKQMNQLSVQTHHATDAMTDFGRVAGLALRRNAGFAIATTAVFGFTSAVIGGVKEAIEFERQMVKVAQVSNRSTSSLSKLRNTITDLSREFGASSADLADVAQTLAQAGFSTSDTEKSLKSLAKTTLAATFGDIQSTTEGAIALMTQFGISATNLEGALDSVNKVSAQFAVESEDIIAAIKRTGGVFAQTSQGITDSSGALVSQQEKLNQFLAIFTSVRATTRESAETIATGLRTIFTRIQRPQTIDFLQELGISLTDLQGKFVGPYQAVVQLSEGLRDLDPRNPLFARVIEELGGFRQVGKVIPLLTQIETRQKALASAQNAQGSITKDATQAQEALAVQLQITREKFLALIRTIAESDTFRLMSDAVLSLTNAFIRFGDAVAPIIPVFAALATIKGGFAISKFLGRGGFLTGLKGGSHQRFASGGYVSGGNGGIDDIPAKLTKGEFVLNRRTVSKLGTSFLNKLNKGQIAGFAKGGFVGDFSSYDEVIKSGISFEKFTDEELKKLVAMDKLALKMKAGFDKLAAAAGEKVLPVNQNDYPALNELARRQAQTQAQAQAQTLPNTKSNIPRQKNFKSIPNFIGSEVQTLPIEVVVAVRDESGKVLAKYSKQGPPPKTTIPVETVVPIDSSNPFTQSNLASSRKTRQSKLTQGDIDRIFSGVVRGGPHLQPNIVTSGDSQRLIQTRANNQQIDEMRARQAQAYDAEVVRLAEEDKLAKRRKEKIDNQIRANLHAKGPALKAAQRAKTFGSKFRSTLSGTPSLNEDLLLETLNADRSSAFNVTPLTAADLTAEQFSAFGASPSTRFNPPTAQHLFRKSPSFGSRIRNQIRGIGTVNNRLNRTGIGRLGGQLASTRGAIGLTGLALGANTIGGTTGDILTGSVGGVAAGAGLGSVAGPFGTAIGAIVGGIVGAVKTINDAKLDAKLRESSEAMVKAVDSVQQALEGFDNEVNRLGFATALDKINQKFANLTSAAQDNISVESEKSGPGFFSGFTLKGLFNRKQPGGGGLIGDGRSQSIFDFDEAGANILANQNAIRDRVARDATRSRASDTQQIALGAEDLLKNLFSRSSAKSQFGNLSDDEKFVRAIEQGTDSQREEIGKFQARRDVFGTRDTINRQLNDTARFEDALAKLSPGAIQALAFNRADTREEQQSLGQAGITSEERTARAKSLLLSDQGFRDSIVNASKLTESLAQAAKEANRAASGSDLLIERLKNLSAVFERASTEGDTFRQRVESISSRRSGGTGIISGARRNIFGNTRAFTVDEIASEARQINTGLGNTATSRELTSAVIGAKQVQANLPRILNELNTRRKDFSGDESGEDKLIRDTVSQNFGGLPKILQDKLTSDIGSKFFNRLSSPDELGKNLQAGNVSAFADEFGSDINNVAQKFVDTFNQNISQYEQVLSQHQAVLREFVESVDTAQEIVFNRAVQRKENLGQQRVTVEDRTAFFNAGVTERSRRAGVTGPINVDTIAAREGFLNSQLQSRSNFGGSPQEVSRAMTEAAAQQVDLKQELIRIRDNTGESVALQNEMNSLLDARRAAENTLQRFQDASDPERREMLRDVETFRRAESGIPVFGQDRERVARGRELARAGVGAARGEEGLFAFDQAQRNRLLGDTAVLDFGRRIGLGDTNAVIRNQDGVFNNLAGRQDADARRRFAAGQAVARIDNRDAGQILQNGQNAFNATQQFMQTPEWINRLNETLGQMPTEIAVGGKIDVTLTLNGGVEGKVGPEIEKLIKDRVEQAIANVMPKDGPSSKPGGTTPLRGNA